MYNNENGFKTDNRADSETQSYRRYSARVTARRRRQCQRMLMIGGLAIAIIVIAIVHFSYLNQKTLTIMLRVDKEVYL